MKTSISNYLLLAAIAAVRSKRPPSFVQYHHYGVKNHFANAFLAIGAYPAVMNLAGGTSIVQ